MIYRAARLVQEGQPLEDASLGLHGAKAEAEHIPVGIPQLGCIRNQPALCRWRLGGVEPLSAEHISVVAECQCVGIARHGVETALPHT